MTRALLVAGFVLFGSAAPADDEIEAEDADFLDYLGSMESDADNWTLLDAADHRPASKDAEGAQPAEKAAAARKSSKEAAKPAVEKR